MVAQRIQEVHRREKAIRTFPNKAPVWRLDGALLAEKHEDVILGLPWSTAPYLTDGRVLRVA
ncbi:hypothetical protein BSZ35_18425 [Salinibacter sp. 10B]|nr:hypothetical protein BSZ35_18425 [Salinibacter sp. 10B]